MAFWILFRGGWEDKWIRQNSERGGGQRVIDWVITWMHITCQRSHPRVLTRNNTNLAPCTDRPDRFGDSPELSGDGKSRECRDFTAMVKCREHPCRVLSLITGNVNVPGCRRGRSLLGTWSRPYPCRARCPAGHRRCPRPYPSSGTSGPSCHCPCRARRGWSRAGGARRGRRRQPVRE